MSLGLSKPITSMLIAIGFVVTSPIAAMSHVNAMHIARPNWHRDVPEAVREAYLYSFKGTPDGSFPTDIITYKGAFYGTTQNGGANGSGSFFVINKTTSGYSERVLYSFPSGTGLSGAPLAVNNSGVFVGTAFLDGTSGTACGGPGGCGDIYALIPTAAGYVHKILHTFDQNRDGGQPQSPLTVGSDGAVYGSTSDYGPGGGGTVFKFTPSNSGYSEQVLYAFGTHPGDGQSPEGPLFVDGAGDVYGVTFYGGSNSSPAEPGAGNAYELTKTAGGYAEHILYQFGSHTGDGVNPSSLLFNPVTGTFFGIASYGGDTGCGYTSGCGTVFELFPSEGYREQTVHVFDGTNGGLNNSLVYDGKGGFLGTTEASGSPLQYFGDLFALTPSTNGFAYSVFYQFTGQNDGHAPCTLLLLNQSLFGLTVFGGQNDNGTPLGDGTFFEITI
jgi:hypothetical protein